MIECWYTKYIVKSTDTEKLKELFGTDDIYTIKEFLKFLRTRERYCINPVMYENAHFAISKDCKYHVKYTFSRELLCYYESGIKGYYNMYYFWDEEDERTRVCRRGYIFDFDELSPETVVI